MDPTSRDLELLQEEALLIGCLGGQPFPEKAFKWYFLASEAATEDASRLLSSRTESPPVGIKNK